MKTELVDISPTRKEIKIEIDSDTIRGVYDSVSDHYAKRAVVPGFRKGHAPRSIVRARFKDDLRAEVLRKLVPDAVANAVSEHSLHILSEPDIHLADDESASTLGDKPLSFDVHIEVMPTVELGEYKGLEAQRSVRPVTDADVDAVIEGLRESSAAMQPVEDRAAELGDTVTANFTGIFIEPPAEEDIKVEDVDVLLGGNGVQQEFTDNLLGARPDDERKFTVHYPEDFTSKGLAGKEIAYTTKVTAVRRKELPDLDDEWAKSLGEDFESLADLRAKVRADLANRSKNESDDRLRNAVMGALVKAHQFEVPETLLTQQTEKLLESIVRSMVSRGVDPRSQKLDWRAARDSLREQAAADVRASLLLEAIAETEQIDVSDDEVNAEINLMATAMRKTEDEVRAALTKEGGERSIADRLRNHKALDLIVENAKVTNREWQENKVEEDEPQDAANTQAQSTTGKD